MSRGFTPTSSTKPVCALALTTRLCRISWFYACLFVVGLTFGTWGFIIYDPSAIASIRNVSLHDTCGMLNLFLYSFSIE